MGGAGGDRAVTPGVIGRYNEEMETLVAYFEAVAGVGIEQRLACRIPAYAISEIVFFCH